MRWEKKININYNLQYSILENPKAKQLTSSMHACLLMPKGSSTADWWMSGGGVTHNRD